MTQKLPHALPRNREFQLIAATFSPMQEDGRINCASVEPYAQYLLRNGIASAFINGSTGESLSLTLDERQSLAEAWVRAAMGQIDVMVHVGHNSVFEAVELARHAELIGASAISAMAPTMFRPKNVDDLIAFLQPIAAAAPQTPFYYYHIPSLTGVQAALDEFLQTASRRIPNLAGVKFTHSNLVELGQCQAKWGHRYNLLFGKDELLLPAMSVGSTGFIGTSYNFAPQTFAQIVCAFTNHDLSRARELSVIANQFVLMMVDRGYLTYGKRLLSAIIGVDCGEARLPLRPSSDSDFESLLAAISNLPLCDDLPLIAKPLLRADESVRILSNESEFG